MPVIKESKDEVVELKPATKDLMYPEVNVHVGYGDDAVDVEQAKNLLGWEEETDDVKFGSDYATTTLAGRKVRLTNNTRNRPLIESWVDVLAQEHLNRRWRRNGDVLKIGKSGETLSAQHRLISLIRAEERRNLVDEAEHWSAYWDGPVTMETIIVFGVDEDDETVNTIDTGVSRTVGDVFYRIVEMQRYPTKERRKIARAMDHAVRMLWHRTGRGEDAFSPTRTHAEAIAFFRDHPKLLDMVSHVATEDEDDKPISRYVSIGYASALCYLFAASRADRAKYDEGGRSEAAIGMTKKRADQAMDFFALLKDGPDLAELRKALDKLDDAETGRVGTLAERVALLVKAWTFWAEGETITGKRLELKYETEPGELPALAETPSCGGIDLGDPAEALADEEDEADASADAQREIEERKREVKKESIAAKLDDKRPSEDEYDDLRAKHPKHVLWFEGKDQYSLFGPDADDAHAIIGCKMSGQKVNGRSVVKLLKNQYVPAMTALNEAGREVAIVRKTDDGVKVERVKPIVAQKAKKVGKK